MKNRNVLFKSIFASVLGCAVGFAVAGDTQNLTVNVTVQGTCKFFTPVQTLSFGTIDPSSTAALTGSGATVSYKCTKGTLATGVTLGNGLNFLSGSRRMGNGTDFIPYTLSLTGGAATGGGFGSGVAASALTFTGGVAVADFQNVSAGLYSDTVVMTLTP